MPDLSEARGNRAAMDRIRREALRAATHPLCRGVPAAGFHTRCRRASRGTPNAESPHRSAILIGPAKRAEHQMTPPDIA
jgi:hypothetical protein